MRLYGKTLLKSRLDACAAEGRLPHAVMLCGERGSGRRTVAKYISKLFMCGAQPCDSCNICKRIDSQTHPDVIYVKHECGGKYNLDEAGKNGLVSMRRVMDSIVIKPNDGNIKIYIFEDADEMSVQIQNTLLKTIEEPAHFLRFIFICESTDSIIETIRSRVTDFSVPMPSVQECSECLVENGVEPAKAKELSEALSGNIGKCMDILSGEGDTLYMQTARSVAAAVAERNGFAVAAALSEQTGRAEFSSVLGYLAEILRDALAVRCGGEAFSCGKNEAAAIAKVYDEVHILDMLDAVFAVSADAALNLNMALTASYLTSKLI